MNPTANTHGTQSKKRAAWIAAPGSTAAVVLACCLALFPVAAGAQTTSELRTLFFDAVYLTDGEEVLLTSGSRPGLQNLAGEIPPVTPPDRQLSDLINDIENYKTNINSHIEESGIFNQELAQEYLALGDAHAQAGNYDDAVAAYENAMHVERVNEGLFTLSQTDAVRKLIDINKASREFQDADKYHEYLYYLLSHNHEPGSDTLRDATLEWADWNLEAFQRMAFNEEFGLSINGDVSNIPSTMLRRGEMVAVIDNISNDVLFVPRSVLFTNPGNIRMSSYTADQLVDPRLKNAEDLYDKLLEEDESAQVRKKKANIVYLFKYQLENYIDVTDYSSPLTSTNYNLVRTVPFLRRGYADSRDSLTEAAESRVSDNPRDAARLYADLADWELLFDRGQRADAAYRKAYDLLVADGMSAEEASAFITPEPAMFAPEFITYEYTREFQGIPETQNILYFGYIDATFNKRANGTLRNIEIVNASENTGQQIRRRLMDMLREIRVRPLVQGGETREQNDIKVRYYYSY